jgi:hypothetical protein
MFEVVLFYDSDKYTCTVMPSEQDVPYDQDVEMVLRATRVVNEGGEDRDYDFCLISSDASPKTPFVGYHNSAGRVRLDFGKCVHARNREKFAFSTVMDPMWGHDPSESSHCSFESILFSKN